MRIAAVAAAGREQVIERRRREIEADDAHVRQRLLQRLDDGREALLDHQRLHRRIGEDEHLLRHREPPVERHQHRAEPRAGIEQHQIVGMIER